ncbi:MAG: hypothetical protein ACQGVC_12670 [Myxococcota bacterium]
MHESKRDAPRLLFVPQGGRGGTGEYARCLTLAHAARARWPGARVAFATKATAARFDDDDYPRYVLPAEPRGGAVERVVWATAPDLVVFNNTGKGPDLAAARRSGARVVYVGSVPRYRRRGLRRELLRQMDALWIFPSDDSESRLSPKEEDTWRRSGRPPLQFFASIFAPSLPERAAKLRARLGVEGDGYLLFVPGGGGWKPRGRFCSDLFVEAAALAARASGLPALVVLGPLHRTTPDAPEGVRVLGYLEQPELMDLVAGARVVATGGGGLLNQALSLGAACVAAPLHRGDQPHRIQEGEARGWLVGVEPEPDAIGAAAASLAGDPARRATLGARLAEAGPRNELDRCMDHLAPLVDAGARPCPLWLRPVRPLRRR